MPQKKKQAKNSFYYFMVEFRENSERRGIFYNGMHEVADAAGPVWSSMTPEEKEPYIKLAAKMKKKDNEDLTKKFTSLGVSYADLDAEQREIEEIHQMMIDTVKRMVNSLSWETTLRTECFFVCHTNYFYKSDKGQYYHAEMALAEFNLKHGLTNKFHCFIDPGKLELGFRFEATDWSQKTHNIPVDDPNWTCGEKNYYMLYRKVMAFLGRDENNIDDIPPIFTMPDSLNNNTSVSATRNLFAKMADAAGFDPGIFRIYTLPYLFFELRNYCAQHSLLKVSDKVGKLPSVAMAESEIEKDVFTYSKNFGCQYHEEKDLITFCSLSVVCRWAYTIFDHCSLYLGIEGGSSARCLREVDARRNREKNSSVPKQTSTKEKKKESSTSPAKENSFMPTIIDHGKLRDEMNQQIDGAGCSTSGATDVRLPRKASYSNAMKVNNSAPRLTDRDFPEINAASSSHSGQRQYQNDSAFPPLGANFGRGRGFGRGLRGGASSSDTPRWPVSGRGSQRPT